MAVLERFTKDPDAVLEYSIRWGAADWVATTNYYIDDTVRDPATGYFYDCIEDHTAGSTSLSENKRQWKKRKRLWLRRGRQINTSAWTQTAKRPSTAADATIDTISADPYDTTIWISGGDVGASYEFTNRVTDDNATPRTDDRTISLTIKEK